MTGWRLRLSCFVKLPGGFDAGLIVAFEQSEQLASDDAAQAPLGVAAA